MKTVSAIILTRTKDSIKKTIGFNENENIEGCDYQVNPNLVSVSLKRTLTHDELTIEDLEVLYFEGNPYPIGYKDESEDLLNYTINVNWIKQVAGVKKRMIKGRMLLLIIIVFMLVAGGLALYFSGALKGLI